MRFLGIASILICLAALTLAGCGSSSSNSPTTSPMEVLKRTADAYRRAGSYADGGELILRYVYNGEQKQPEPEPFSVTLVRLNKLRMHYYKASVVCDGKDFWATISDQPDKQVLMVPAPKKLSLQSLYEIDPTLSAALMQGIGGDCLPLSLLLLDNGQDVLLADQQGLELLSADKCGDDLCYRVQVKRSNGMFVYWIDQKSYVIRRLEYPSEAVRMAMGAGSDTAISQISLTAEFHRATLNPKVEEVAFKFETPSDAKVVQKFPHVPLPPEPPSPLLGKKISNFTFTSLDGKPVTRASLEGQIVVVDFWIDSDANAKRFCLEQLGHLEEVFQKFKAQSKVRFLTVSLDPAVIGVKSLTDTFVKAHLNLPLVRDPEQKSLETFEMKNIPNLFVLGPDGTVEDHLLGSQPNLVSDLSASLEMLLKGESSIKLAQERYEQKRREYEQAMSKITASQVEPVPINKAHILPASEAATLQLSKLWNCDQLTHPGNIMVVGGAGEASPRILVFDGLRTIVELDSEGKIAKKHELELPASAEISVLTYLRTAVDASGKRYFAASGPSQQALHLYDEQFKKLLSFPIEGNHAGISDVQLADLDGDGEPEINVGYWGLVGVHNVSLTGVRRWTNRSVSEVLGLAVTAADPQKQRRLLVTHQSSGTIPAGSMVPIDYQGRTEREIIVPERFITKVIGADLDGDNQPELCALALGFPSQTDPTQKEMVIGLGQKGEAVWSFDLPPGTQHHAALEMVTAGNLLGGDFGQWVIAAADGTIHIIGFDGAKVDHFASGHALTGIAVATWDGQRVLLLANEKEVEAWKVEKKSTGPE